MSNHEVIRLGVLKADENARAQLAAACFKALDRLELSPSKPLEALKEGDDSPSPVGAAVIIDWMAALPPLSRFDDPKKPGAKANSSAKHAYKSLVKANKTSRENAKKSHALLCSIAATLSDDSPSEPSDSDGGDASVKVAKKATKKKATKKKAASK